MSNSWNYRLRILKLFKGTFRLWEPHLIAPRLYWYQQLVFFFIWLRSQGRENYSAPGEGIVFPCLVSFTNLRDMLCHLSPLVTTITSTHFLLTTPLPSATLPPLPEHSSLGSLEWGRSSWSALSCLPFKTFTEHPMAPELYILVINFLSLQHKTQSSFHKEKMKLLLIFMFYLTGYHKFSSPFHKNVSGCTINQPVKLYSYSI